MPRKVVREVSIIQLAGESFSASVKVLAQDWALLPVSTQLDLQQKIAMFMGEFYSEMDSLIMTHELMKAGKEAEQVYSREDGLLQVPSVDTPPEEVPGVAESGEEHEKVGRTSRKGGQPTKSRSK